MKPIISGASFIVAGLTDDQRTKQIQCAIQKYWATSIEYKILKPEEIIKLLLKIIEELIK
jgi:hypothetical protein